MNKFNSLRLNVELFGFIAFALSAKFIHLTSPYLFDGINASWNFGLQLPFKLYVGLYVTYAAIKLGSSPLAFRVNRFANTNLACTDFLLVCAILGLSIFQLIFFLLGMFGLLQEWLIFTIFLLSSLIPNHEVHIRLVSVYIKLKRSIINANLSSVSTYMISMAMLIYIFNIYIAKSQVPLHNDFIHHYGQYFIQTALEEHIRPNQVWYQFFYSKGDALSIALIKIVDITAKLLTSFIYFALTCLILLRLVAITTKSPSWGIFSACLLCITIFIDNTQAFEKQHIAVMYCLGGTLYCIVLLINHETGSALQKCTACFLASSTVLLSLPSTAYLGSLIFITILYLTYIKKWVLAKQVLIFALFTLTAMLALFTINIFSTGILELTPFRVFLPHIYYPTLSKWISPYLITYVAMGTDLEMGKVNLDLSLGLTRFFELSRLKLLSEFTSIYPLIILIISAVFPLSKSKSTAQLKNYLVICTFGGLLIAFLSYVTISQPLSVYRATQFVAFYTCILIGIGFSNIELILKKISPVLSILWRHFSLIVIVIPIFTFIPLNSRNEYRLAMGHINLDNYYYLNQPPSTSDGYVLIHQLRKEIGFKEKILSLDQAANFGRYYLTGSGLITELSYSLGPYWHKIGLESAEIAKTELKKMGVNYFIINLETAHIGLLPYSNLFSSNHVNEYFDVIGSSGSWKALTWKKGNGNRTKLTPQELKKWDQAKNGSKSYKPLFTNTELIYDYNANSTGAMPLLPPYLPKSNGWQ